MIKQKEGRQNRHILIIGRMMDETAMTHAAAFT